MKSRESELLRLAHEAMLGHFGPLGWWPARSPFEVVVGAILTQNTAWRRVVPAIDDLRRHGLLEARLMHAVPEADLAELIRPAGTHRVKAGYLRATLDWLVDRYGGSVEAALAGDTEPKRKELLAIRGIGRETADCLLVYAGGHPVFVVDAYTRRIFARHGMIDPAADYDALRAWFEARLPRDVHVLGQAHAQIVMVGKSFCRPRRPRCSACPLEFLFARTGTTPPADAT